MEAVILAAGNGSRMGEITQNLPKIFIDINEKSLYRHQVERIAPYCDQITFVLGHGFETNTNPASKFVLEDLESEVEFDFKVIDDWENKENAHSAFVGLQDIHDDTLLICGDVIFTQEVIQKIVNRFSSQFEPAGFNGVGAIEGLQDQMTSVRWDEHGVITEYGAIEGHQEIGVFVLHSDYMPEAQEILKQNPDNWFPIIFQELPSKRIIVDEEERHEINTPEHLDKAREKWDKRSLELTTGKQNSY
ncbi:hypothetical protein D3D02_16885 [Halobellus sp. Atlit-38R]|uniref:NTP transferase domain-containing protein n=1 Tax=Halobellus sp. Atlit-38R TaxID=2282131 RepID=UPI000EF17E4B|nr:NTP transferase domain-containing protein [Halobellus sp. Atlit-38R]RLM83756.1 hypothetical protein D3D02_16885 [Halobellus sp. Atlit-38R]